MPEEHNAGKSVRGSPKACRMIIQKGSMKILYIANRPDVFSGGEISLLELISRIDRRRFEPVLLCPGEGSFAERARSAGIVTEIRGLPSMRTLDLPGVFRAAGKIRDVIREHAIDIVHTNGMRAQFYASLAVKGTGSSLLWHVRESARDWPLYESYLAGRADFIVCVSEGVRQAHFSGNERLLAKSRVIYNGVDTKTFSRDPEAGKRIRAELGVSDTQQLIGTMGLFIPRKGQDVLLKAFKRLAGTHPGVRLLMAGKVVDDAYFKSLKALSDGLGLGKSVLFAEPRPDVRDVLSALDVFVLPSSREGFSRVLLEAMACALPVVASDVAGNNEAVAEGETGFLVPFGDDIRLEEALEKILSNKKRAIDMGRKARERVERAFTIQKCVDLTEALYLEIGICRDGG